MERAASVAKKLAVVGNGSWGTAQVKLLSENGHQVRWWMRKPEDVAYVQAHGHNPSYLSDVSLDLARVLPTHSLADALQDAEIVFLVVPAAFVGAVLAQVAPAWLQDRTVVSGIKGIVPGENLLITDYLERHLGVPGARQAILAGPCHAEEVALEKQSYLTIGATNLETATQVATLLQGRFMTCSPSLDLYGLEYAAILKNIVAIACGIAHGLRYGDNFLAVLVSNALKEIEDFVQATCPPCTRRMADSGYVGDVLVTSYSQFSRNRTFGTMLGRGYSVQAAQLEMNMVAEGYYASRCIGELNERHRVAMPVIETVHGILYQKQNPRQAFERLAGVLR